MSHSILLGKTGFINMRYFLIIIVTAAFILGQFARVQLGNLGVTLIDIIILITSGMWMGKYFLIERKRIKNSQILMYLMGFFVSGITGLILFSSKLTPQEIIISLLYPLRLISYLSLFYVIKNSSEKTRKDIFKFLIVSGVVIVGIGFVQYFFYQSLGNLRYLGWDEHLYRLFSTFLDPNFAGAFLAIFILILVEIVISMGDKNKKLIFILLIFLAFVAEILTYSRTGFIMLLVGLGVFLLSFVSKKITIIILLTCLLLFFAAANTKIEGLNPFRIASSEARIESMGDAAKIITKHPLFGVGFNSYRYAQVQMGFRQELPNIQSHSDSGTDNSFLFALATTGVIGGIFFTLFLFSILGKSWKLASQKDFLARSFFASLVSVLVGSFFINALFYPMILGWLVVVGALIQSRKF